MLHSFFDVMSVKSFQSELSCPNLLELMEAGPPAQNTQRAWGRTTHKSVSTTTEHVVIYMLDNKGLPVTS